ncbi:hypothetical protein V6x_52420 [Gimesia chilikensis]|uniref:Uncharacterized protein n=1 Tax=Gimesia chilikensis TaxID=2605989 RepID=A0A517WJS0_9PLAN|nr:hypothetical protein V6x_52420 [Gimesia chilikensis]
MQLYHLTTDICTFHIRAPKSLFEITLHTWKGSGYSLYIEGEPIPIANYTDPYGACRAVATHKTNFGRWDSAGIVVSDYILDWTCDVDKKLKIQLVSDYLDKAPTVFIAT